MKGYRFLEVVWLDPCSGSEWCTKDELPKPVTVTTRGWLVYECPEYIVLARTYQHHADGHVVVGECIAVTNGCIQQIGEVILDGSREVPERTRGNGEICH